MPCDLRELDASCCCCCCCCCCIPVSSTSQCTSRNSFYNNNNIRRYTSGYIQSPSYPLYYPDNMQCTWIISAPSGKKVELRFTYFSLDSDTCLLNDYVEVREGSSVGKSLGTFCGFSKPATIRSSGRTVWVRFRSDDMVNYKGFKAQFTSTTTSSSSKLHICV